MLARKLQARSEITRKISIRDFTLATGGDKQKWQKTAGVKQLLEEVTAYELDA